MKLQKTNFKTLHKYQTQQNHSKLQRIHTLRVDHLYHPKHPSWLLPQKYPEYPQKYPEYSVENHLNAVTDNLISNTGPESINLSLQQNWIHRRTSLTQVTLDSAAQNCFSALRIEIKYHCK